jgi:hypothetical protein
MERHILRYSYWLGVTSAVVAMVWRLIQFLGYFTTDYAPGMRLGYMTFFKGAVLLLLIAVASASSQSAATKS